MPHAPYPIPHAPCPMPHAPCPCPLAHAPYPLCMSYCLNPYCDHPHNPDGTKFCRRCGSKLLLKERYRGVKLIGQGGFGRTFLAVDEHKPSQPQCVIKQFFIESQDPKTVQKAEELFEQEAVRLEQLGKHPQIPELLAHFSQDNRQYLVQEFIDGQNLGENLQANGAFSETQIWDLLKSLLPVLKFIHDHNIIHRDIKPDNIIRCSQESGGNIIPPDSYTKMVLVDFGAAKYATGTALFKTGTTIGTPEYIAPEQSKGKAVFSSDLYSLGVTCVHLLTQVSPLELFDTDEDTWVWRRYLANNPISLQLEHILDKLLQKAIRRRYQSAVEVIQDLSTQPTRLVQFPSLVFKPITAKPSIGILSTFAPAKQAANWQIIHTLTGHSGSVESVAINPDQTIIASASSDRTIKLWHLPDGEEISTLQGHNDRVCAVIFSPDGQTIISGSYDRTIKLWQVPTGQEIGTRLGHTKWITALAISPDGNILISGSSEGTMKLWQMPQGTEIYTLPGDNQYVSAIAISPDGDILASLTRDGAIKIWQLSTATEIYTLGNELNWRLGLGCSLAFSPDRELLAVGKSDGTISLWELSQRRESAILKGHSHRVRAIAFHPDGQTLASGSMDYTIKIWQIGDRQAIKTLNSHTGEIYTLTFSPNGQILATGSMDKTIKIWHSQ